jgi:hypothetical protein
LRAQLDMGHVAYAHNLDEGSPGISGWL